MNIKEKVAFIKGMMEGMNFENNSNEKKFFDAVVDILSDISLEIEDLKDDNEYLNDYVEELDEDLGDLEEFVYESEKDDDDDDYDDDDDDDDEEEDDDDDDEYDDDDDGICKMECDCGKLVDIDPDNIKDGKIVCPYCFKEYDINEICEGCEGCN